MRFYFSFTRGWNAGPRPAQVAQQQVRSFYRGKMTATVEVCPMYDIVRFFPTPPPRASLSVM